MINNILTALVSSQLSWKIVYFLAKALKGTPGVERVFQRLLYQKVLIEAPNIQQFINTRIPNLKVTSGPFCEMLYPWAKSVGSMLAPKLLGTYESEISTFFETANLSYFKTIVDIGCAEGYYAIGIALQNPQSRIFAYDISKTARELCEEMAKANGVFDRVTINGACSKQELISYGGRRSLIISDCEGYEMELFDMEVINSLKDEDFLIEVHEHLGANLKVLIDRFNSTHKCEVIRSIGDLEKSEYYSHDLLTNTKPTSGSCFWLNVGLSECIG